MKIKCKEGFTISFDKKEALRYLKNYVCYEDLYGSCWGHDGIDVTEEDFNDSKDQMIKVISESTAEKLAVAINKALVITKKGTIHGSRRMIAIEMDAPLSYSDEHGSHSYEMLGLRIHPGGIKKGTMSLETYKVQESF